MKKIIIILGIMIFTNLIYGANIYLKGGFTAAGKYEYKTKESVKPSFVGAIDMTAKIVNTEIGAGFGFEKGADFKDREENMDVTFIPMYLMGKVNAFGPYFIAKLGYSLPIPKDALETAIDNQNLSLEGGVYYGVGIGYQVKMLVVEGIYSVSKGKIDDLELEYKKLSLMAGIKF